MKANRHDWSPLARWSWRARELARQPVPPANPQERDALPVRLEIESEGKAHPMDEAPESLPEKYAALFDYLREHGKPMPL